MSEITNTSSPRRGTLSYPAAPPKEDVRRKGAAKTSEAARKTAPLLDPSRNRAGPPRREEAVARMNANRRIEDARVVANVGAEDVRFGFGGGGDGGFDGFVEEPCTDCAAKAAAKSDNTMLYLLAAFLLLGGVG